MRYFKYVPGYRFQAEKDWIIEPGKLVIDPTIDPTLDPGEVFTIGRLHTNAARRPAESDFVNIHFSANAPNVWDEMGWSWNALCWTLTSSSFYLFKIENDSVLTGDKPVGDPNDYRLVDMFGSSTAENWDVGGQVTTADGTSVIRKPEVWKGNPEDKGSWGTNEEDTEWIVKIRNSGYSWDEIAEDVGTHTLDPATVYISKVSSFDYLVSDEF